MQKLAFYIAGMGSTLAIYFFAAQDMRMFGLTLFASCASLLTAYLVDDGKSTERER